LALGDNNDESGGPELRSHSTLVSWGDGEVFEREAAEEDDVVLVRVDSLSLTGSPRLAGEDAHHTKTLVEIEDALPPIVVHRATRRVIDGVHRVRAAMLRQEQLIRARFFDGTSDQAFLLAIRSNVTHGLPLSLADRKSAATRIIDRNPQWSDRAVAEAAGLAAKTVAAIRRSPTDDRQRSDMRLGRDGRVRPVSGAAGRLRVYEEIIQRPEASLREIARLAGVSPETVRHVRARIERGEDPVARRGGSVQAGPTIESGSGAPEPKDMLLALNSLKRDPTLRFTDTGRSLLRWIDAQLVVSGTWPDLVEGIPPHCTDVFADVAKQCSESLLQFAIHLEQRSSSD
jgi:hypothetical protein